MGVLLVLEAERLDGAAQTDLVADGVLKRGIVPLDDADYLVAVHRLDLLTLIRQAEAGGEHLTDVLLIHEIEWVHTHCHAAYPSAANGQRKSEARRSDSSTARN